MWVMADPKHLEFLQAAITRTAGNAFVAKGWSITIVTVALGLAVKDGWRGIAIVAAVPAAMFWLLDAYYLALERGFRTLFEEAVANYHNGRPASFRMDPGNPFAQFPRILFRPAVAIVHVPLVLTLVAAWRLP